jgi:DAACS family dicarboxylate/amino acid:cation (Na+ or H+) symporter
VSIRFIVVVLATIHVNPALIAVILRVDRILDMCRTTLNVVDDVTAATYVARSEGSSCCGTSPTDAVQSAFPQEALADCSTRGV